MASHALLSMADAQTLPEGYFIWTKGDRKKPSTRKIYRMTFPGRDDVRALTTGEDVEGRISPDGKWVAFAKAKLEGGSDYHAFNLWKVYIVSIHGVGKGRKEIKIDDDEFIMMTEDEILGVIEK